MRWLGYGLLTLVCLAAAGVGYLYLAFPIMTAPSKQELQPSDAQLERGAYLAEHVAVCVDCHSERDWSRYSGPVEKASFGKGGERFGHDQGLPGEIFAANITPARLGSWSDGELVRAVTSGVTPDGRALFPLMPYPSYGKLCREDAEALVSYVRTLAPSDNVVPETTLDFPLNLIVRTLPQPAQLVESCPDASDTVKRGAYLANMGGCQECHTPRKGNDLDVERMFAGGSPFPMMGVTVTSKNLTPDASGIGSWSREAFIERFAYYRDRANLHHVDKGDLQTPMPWSMYAGMTDADLGAIYDFLRTVKPVQTAPQAVAAN
ncbi:MAG TPA: c-type cytochrome [Polyangiales bacterium]|nr:c-type cytochrome [Polyangiales bacterium]